MSLLFIFLSTILLNSAQDNYIGNIYKDSSLASSVYGVYIGYINGQKIFSSNENLNLVPGSSIKILTTALALHTLGPEYRIKTELYYSGEIKENILYGDLIIKGYGDITLGSENFSSSIEKVEEDFTKAINEVGIKKIKGNIIIDNSYYKYSSNGSWPWEDIGNYYAAFPSPFSINDNSYKIYFKKTNKPGQKAEIENVIPDMDFKIKNEVITGDKGSGDNSYIYSLPWSKEIKIIGSVPPGEFFIKGAMGNPSEFFLNHFKNYLISNRVAFEGNLLSVNEEINKKKLLKTFYSPTLKDIVKVIHAKSFNLYTEGLRNIIEKEKNDNFDKIMKNFLARYNLDYEKINLSDNCGLSRLNYISAGYFFKFLDAINRDEYFDNFYSSLSYPRDTLLKGHLRNMDKNGALGDNLRIKSGSLKYVRSYVGYIKTKKNRLVGFSSIVNNYNCDPKSIDSLHEKIFVYIYENY